MIDKEFSLRFLNRIYILPQGEVLIGRDKICHICLDGELVSRKHAKITIRNNNPVIEDLQSDNGTFVNDVKLTGSRILQHGDRIRIAFFIISFEETTKKHDNSKTIQMVFCTNCGSVLTPDMRYCIHCGNKVKKAYKTILCPSCHSIVTKDMKFCFYCGYDLKKTI